jgi:hypothetical protein
MRVVACMKTAAAIAAAAAGATVQVAQGRASGMCGADTQRAPQRAQEQTYDTQSTQTL